MKSPTSYKNDTLPDKPTALVKVALADLELCELDPAYHINMGFWHKYNKKKDICQICLAGSVMAKSLGQDRLKGLHPDMVTHNKFKLKALDCFRTGDVHDGLMFMGFESCDQNARKNFIITDYHDNPAQFKTDMRNLADYLEAKGY